MNRMFGGMLAVLLPKAMKTRRARELELSLRHLFHLAVRGYAGI